MGVAGPAGAVPADDRRPQRPDVPQLRLTQCTGSPNRNLNQQLLCQLPSSGGLFCSKNVSWQVTCHVTPGQRSRCSRLVSEMQKCSCVNGGGPPQPPESTPLPGPQVGVSAGAPGGQRVGAQRPIAASRLSALVSGSPAIVVECFDVTCECRAGWHLHSGPQFLAGSASSSGYGGLPTSQPRPIPAPAAPPCSLKCPTGR